ncbi:hypothetical protein C8J57DRAFT_1488870 [Mycena rebaudengoi]|nr:hypothetical protein C8J57DRAFT_1488870 [Mycena rebaudengoi]
MDSISIVAHILLLLLSSPVCTSAQYSPPERGPAAFTVFLTRLRVTLFSCMHHFTPMVLRRLTHRSFLPSAVIVRAYRSSDRSSNGSDPPHYYITQWLVSIAAGWIISVSHCLLSSKFSLSFGSWNKHLILGLVPCVCLSYFAYVPTRSQWLIFVSATQLLHKRLHTIYSLCVLAGKAEAQLRVFCQSGSRQTPYFPPIPEPQDHVFFARPKIHPGIRGFLCYQPNKTNFRSTWRSKEQ